MYCRLDRHGGKELLLVKPVFTGLVMQLVLEKQG